LDIHSNSCRLAFEGRLISHYEDKSYRTKELPQLKIFKFKEKKGQVSDGFFCANGS
jgi:selenocysteine-specific elongation factor